MFKKDPLLQISSSPHSPHNIIQTLIKPQTTILDVGCNTGFLGKSLKKKKCIVDGIDINDAALKQAKKYCRNTYKRDLYKGILDIPKKKYDYIVFADLLEHLPRPDLILQDTHKYLKKDGKVIISLPNIARLEIRLQLLQGKFKYTYGGILSEDHLRFFTRETATELLKNCGYSVEESIPTGLGHRIPVLHTLFAFQFIYVCSHS